MNKILKGIIIGTIIGSSAGYYGSKVNENTKELSDAIEPLRVKFENVVQTTAPKVNLKYDGAVRVFDYGGKLEKIAAAKNEFAKDNGAYARRWDVGNDVKPRASTSAPIAWNPKYWNKKIDDSAIRNYRQNNNYRTKK